MRADVPSTPGGGSHAWTPHRQRRRTGTAGWQDRPPRTGRDPRSDPALRAMPGWKYRGRRASGIPANRLCIPHIAPGRSLHPTKIFRLGSVHPSRANASCGCTRAQRDAGLRSGRSGKSPRRPASSRPGHKIRALVFLCSRSFDFIGTRISRMGQIYTDLFIYPCESAEGSA